MWQAIKSAIKKEERALCKLTEGRRGYDVLSWGVGRVYENILVFLIYKELLDRFPEYAIEWESPYPNNSGKRVDLYFKQKQARWEYYIEAKWYYSEGIASDYKKLSLLKRRHNIKRYLLVFNSRQSSYGWSLKKKIDRLELTRTGKIRWANDSEKTIDIHIRRACDKDNNNEELEGLFEIALLEVNK